MVRVFFTLLYFIASSSILMGQNASLNANVLTRVQFQGNNSDVWGYQKNGINYAIIGNATKTSVFSLEDPTLFITSCSAVKDLLQYHFADGFYRTSSLGAKNELVFVDNSEDTVLIYPTLREGSDYTPDIESGLVLVFPNQQVGSPCLVIDFIIPVSTLTYSPYQSFTDRPLIRFRINSAPI